MADPNIPTPGSPEAIAAGCLCPVIDNCHGKGWLNDGEPIWIMDGDCPLHGLAAAKEADHD